MARKQVSDAIRVFELNVRAYPRSYRVYEDLGTAFALSGDDAQAAMQFRKSLELNPSNLDAMDALEALQKKSGTGR